MRRTKREMKVWIWSVIGTLNGRKLGNGMKGSAVYSLGGCAAAQ